MIRLLVVLFVAATVLPASAALQWFPPRFDDGNVIVVPKAHYNSRDHFGLSLEAIRPFRTALQSGLSNDSEFRLSGRLHSTGNGSAEATALVFFGDGAWSLKANVEYRSLIERFWGIGPDTPSTNEELYRPQDVMTYVELFHRVFDGFRLGARVEWNDYRYVDVEDGGLLDTREYPGLCCDNATGAGLVLEFDRRDNVYAPRSGFYAQGFFLAFSEDLRGDYGFQNFHLDLRSYHDLGGGNVLALQAFSYALFGDAPIWRYAAVGGRGHSRGYQRGRYLERRMAAFQAEWRRPIVGRLDGVLFGGLANVARRYNFFKFSNMRPTLGGGLRL